MWNFEAIYLHSSSRAAHITVLWDPDPNLTHEWNEFSLSHSVWFSTEIFSLFTSGRLFACFVYALSFSYSKRDIVECSMKNRNRDNFRSEWANEGRWRRLTKSDSCFGKKAFIACVSSKREKEEEDDRVSVLWRCWRSSPHATSTAAQCSQSSHLKEILAKNSHVTLAVGVECDEQLGTSKKKI